ncbi:HAD hydrolase-like protein [Bowdeniella nasicola]
MIDSGPTIIGSIREALAECGLPDVPAERARGCVGPPLIDGLPRFCDVPLDRLDEIIAAYRTIYATQMTSAPLYPEIPDTLAKAAELGIINAVATAKPETAARTILAAHDLTDAFTFITGADPERGINHKEQVIELCLERLSEAGYAGDPLMIGDRSYDMEGARACNIDAVFARRGYGEASEAGDFPAIDSPTQLLDAPYAATSPTRA